jgi:hypothetical protein
LFTRIVSKLAAKLLDEPLADGKDDFIAFLSRMP